MSEDIINESVETKELRCEKYGITKTPTSPQTGWAPTNQTGNQRTPDLDVTAEVGDALGQLIADLIAKGIISA